MRITNICTILTISFQKSREEWLDVFYIAASIYVFGFLVYIIFGSAELEPWAAEKPKPKEVNQITENGC